MVNQGGTAGYEAAYDIKDRLLDRTSPLPGAIGDIGGLDNLRDLLDLADFFD